jgi:hypothetical protein
VTPVSITAREFCHHAQSQSSPNPVNNALAALFILMAALSLTIGQTNADPAWKSELTAPSTGPHPRLAPIDLNFQLSWKGMIDSGKLRIEFAPADAKKSGAFVIRSSASSIGPAAVLFPYQNHFWSELDPVSFRPRYFNAREIDDKEDVTTTIRHFADRVECKEEAKLLKSGITTTDKRIFRFAPVFDIFSAMLHVRSQNLADGDRITIVICPFKSPYLLRVRVIAHEVHHGRPAIRLTVGMAKIDRKTLELLPYKKLRQDATLWLSDDTDRVPLEFRAAAFIGDVRATLVHLQKR